jgi:glycosyltransferase involved in cell wall biosynthesis
MRIAVATRHVHRAGGVETYLEQVIPALAARGHHLGVWFEFEPPAGAECFLPREVPVHRIGGEPALLSRLAAWSPDLVFLHGLSDPSLEARLADVAPLAILLHAYHGTCISGTKTHLYPSPSACCHSLGPGCLLRYYPRRCGGWHPVSMISQYARQRRRLALLDSCAVVVTLSDHMRRECLAHGIDAARVVRLPPFAPRSLEPPAPRDPHSSHRWHLLFAGRMETLKGGHLLLDALGQLDSAVRLALRVTFVGDGRERERWMARASRVARGAMDIRFAGWLSGRERIDFFRTVDLLIVPSIWPEPLGLIGLEAASAGVPAIAFDTGGIREWLIDGVTGRVVAGPPSAAGLASSIEEAVSAPATIDRWSHAAFHHARQLTLSDHVDALDGVLRGAAGASDAHAATFSHAHA